MRHRRKRKSANKLLLVFCFVLVGFCLLGIFVLSQTFLSKGKTTEKTTVIAHKKKRIDASSSVAQIGETTKTESTWQKEEKPVSIPILMYHAIHDMDPSEAESTNLIVSPSVFESHIKRLKDEGYYFLSPEEAYKALTENSLPSQKVVWLTFDDGDEDFYTQAYPILKKYGAKATNNVITGFVENGNAGNLTLDQMQEMKKNGMSFQAHTVTHTDLSTQPLDRQSSELTDSKSFLDKALSQDTIALAYPSGRYNDTTLQVASQTYKLAMTTNEGLAEYSDGLLSLDRVRVLPSMTADDLLASMQASL
ncbi:polysaccharide deacetylase family protein [Streptococcus sciuri]|uniref:Polysaccharide deacetylase family protein n=1 Tax=Streptococcus sciuri TaxID=2973939 RepID=A0ABT2F861_9STRE|nr:polysaccharide deacetylase family protein [Streptococcus sciuri]MCS4488661.1 polysaccharide deacetylase family protein [Streptococcus sciuri]